MLIFHSPRYNINIGTHVFPTIKYGRVYERLKAEGPRGLEFVEPEPASWEDLAIVHTPQYLQKLKTGDFTVEELALLEVPWSPDVVEGFRVMVGGTIEAARSVLAAEEVGGTLEPARSVLAAKESGSFFTESGEKGSRFLCCCHLGGGLHHAFPGHGEGFCVFNDVAVAIRILFRDRLASRAAVVDLDVHQGNGTAFIFESDPRVFTFSMHQQHNYPMHKPRGSLDIGLRDRTPDAEYLDRLKGALDQVFAHEPDVVFYLAGADPYEDDQLGGLALTKAGLRQRDREVFQACRKHRVRVVVLLAGGYARKLEDTVDIHYATVQEAANP